jgi:DNA-binding NarL/FixJ family response regulator
MTARKTKKRDTSRSAKAAPAPTQPAAADAPAPAASGKQRVFVVDDHPIVRQGLVQMINNQPDLVVCGQGDDTFGALRAIRDARPDLALVDVSLKDGDGIELVKELKSQGLAMPVLMLSMHDETLYAERALRALAGEVYVSQRMGGTLLQRMVGGRGGEAVSPMERLTDRELEIFRMIGAGQTVKEIADKLCLSAKTVEAHREHIKEKLNLKTSAELLRFAIRNTPDEN